MKVHHSLAWMDRVLVMDGGKLVDDGKPRDLLADTDGSLYYGAANEKDGHKAVEAELQVAVWPGMLKNRAPENDQKIDPLNLLKKSILHLQSLM